MAETAVLCPLCERSIDTSESSVLAEKGATAINEASKTRGTSISVEAGNQVHVACRKTFTNKIYLSKIENERRRTLQEKTEAEKVVLRSRTPSFNFQECCFFCTTRINLNTTHRKGHEWYKVRTKDFEESIKAVCKSRDDDWSNNVFRRICAVSDLHAVDAIYHAACSSMFRLNKSLPARFATQELFGILEDTEPDKKRPKRGRPGHDERYQAFLKLATFFEENDEEQYTVSELVVKMGELLNGTDLEPYSNKYLKSKLLEYFSDQLVFATIDGKADVVTFKEKASAILQNFYYLDKTDNEESEKIKLIRAAAKIIKSDIKGLPAQKESYMTAKQISSGEQLKGSLPNSLMVFLDEIFVGTDISFKVLAIGNSIVQAARPRALICPLQLGLAVQLDHHFKSRFLIDTLHSHGFCSSYAEVQKFKRCASVHDESSLAGVTSAHAVQHVADNADHDVCTMDGRNTFHGMALLATVTPPLINSRSPIPRVEVSLDEVAQKGKIPIYPYRLSETVLSKVQYEKIPGKNVNDPYASLDQLWLATGFLNVPRPSWNGFMQSVFSNQIHHETGNLRSKASVLFLPMIDLPSSNESCLYSTLRFVASQGRTYGFTPVLTFDQPLWWKSMKILKSDTTNELSSIVLKLGGFHLMMSFVGCIGHLMQGSGLKEVLELVYATGAVPHILSGKAISRAVRSHILVSSAIYAHLLEEEQATLTSLDMSTVFANVLDGYLPPEDLSHDPQLKQLENFLKQRRQDLLTQRTAKLWFQYLDMVGILLKFIRAERLGLWDLHLQSAVEMLPFLAASGHNLYVKSVWIYQQEMAKLQTSHPPIFEAFEQGGHTIRRSERRWAGLSADLVIEQEYMRSLKTSGGLTTGGGMTEQQRAIWVLSRPACLEINLLMQNLTKIGYSTSEQHRDMSSSRKERDFDDTQKLVGYFGESSPFRGDNQLRNIANGITSSQDVNVDEADVAGKLILSKMTGKTLKEQVFKKKDQVTLMNAKKAGSSVVAHIDPALLFQRFIIVAQRTDLREEYFKYELCTIPPSLFESDGLMRKANKPELAKAIFQACGIETQSPSRPASACNIVLDGGSLLHRVPWKVGSTFKVIFASYVHYVQARYPSAIVVFDGYEGGPAIKDATHLRRARMVGRQVFFTEEMTLCMKKEEFLSCKTNKGRFLKLLGNHLEAVGFRIFHSEGDADVLIVEKAVEAASLTDTIVVADDTDILVLLISRSDSRSGRLYFSPEAKFGGTSSAWDISEMKQKLGTDVSNLIPFCHAVLGCDTTSHLYGIGKGKAVQLLLSNKSFRDSAAIFGDKLASLDDIVAAGERALLILYGCPDVSNLDTARKLIFHRKVSTATTFVHPQELPPTQAAAKYHSLRVYCQVQIWLGNPVDPLRLGWKLQDNEVFAPIKTDLPAAPSQLLKIIKCSCRIDGCDSEKCTCKKNGLECTIACRTCKGSSCNNSKFQEEELSEEE